MGDSDRGALGDQGEPALRIVRGQPGEEELAALMAVLLVLRTGGARADGEAAGPSSDTGWADDTGSSNDAAWWRGPDEAVRARAPRGRR
ncbi:acyl-CoA carboxylase subunit epsilon [Streptomyces sp. b94]|uniref:acyl-CoA carboxylase subunit epsilon n=1 Tax=Streptomyces sp. b94 TaxID=1827634 RepID=UPI001B369991|nr:acyl-CoA carboxylase subunit epsilon [Streptomyces sp. b94]MBQ1099190.1 acyl-CoA carboxylase subunit epsilon [Streptomyces sp. b94]